jgi:AcrR family transcriptional regulator
MKKGRAAHRARRPAPAAVATRVSAQPRRGRSRRASAVPAPTSKSRILSAAAAEFAALGFAGTGVDRIADRARLNKAMIYYHFKSKTALYHEVLREMFRATGERVSRIAAAHQSPVERLQAFVAAIADEAARRPHFPPILLRELAEDGRHLDNTTLSLLQVMPRSFIAIL